MSLPPIIQTVVAHKLKKLGSHSAERIAEHSVFYWLDSNPKMRQISYLKGAKQIQTEVLEEDGNGTIENLASYRENVDVRTQTCGSGSFSFDIERIYYDHSSRPHLPPEYSMMIDARFLISDMFGLSRDEFEMRAKNLPGFVLDYNFHDVKNHERIGFSNKRENIFVNWSNDDGQVTVGVIQDHSISSLQVVNEKIVPFAISIFNQLYPEKAISIEVMKAAVEVARIADREKPKPPLNAIR